MRCFSEVFLNCQRVFRKSEFNKLKIRRVFSVSFNITNIFYLKTLLHIYDSDFGRKFHKNMLLSDNITAN